MHLFKYLNNKKVMAHFIQGIFLLLSMLVYLFGTNILDVAVHHFILATMYIVFNLFIMLILIYIVQNILITFVKICYCKRNKLKLKSIDLSLVFIELKPFRAKLMISSNFLTANNLTTFYLENLCKEKEFVEVYDQFLIPFSHLVKVAMAMTVLVGTIFLYYRLYYIFIEILGLALYRIMYMSIDTDHDIMNPIISKNDDGYQINLYRQMLTYCRTEDNADKEKIYHELSHMTFFQDNKYWQYNCEVIIEMIFDSIIDNKDYISKDDYKLYLSHNNIPVVQGLKLNTMDVLRYFAVYNQLKGDRIVFQEIIDDMRNQVIEIEFGEEPILKWFVNMYWRYVNELEDGKVHLLKDFRHDFYYYFDVFSTKRILVSQQFNVLK